MSCLYPSDPVVDYVVHTFCILVADFLLLVSLAGGMLKCPVITEDVSVSLLSFTAVRL